jgi:hypothetical protein
MHAQAQDRRECDCQNYRGFDRAIASCRTLVGRPCSSEQSFQLAAEVKSALSGTCGLSDVRLSVLKVTISGLRQGAKLIAVQLFPVPRARGNLASRMKIFGCACDFRARRSFGSPLADGRCRR